MDYYNISYNLILTPEKIKSIAVSAEIISKEKGHPYLSEDFAQYIYLVLLKNPARKSKYRQIWYDFLMSERVLYREKQGSKRKPFPLAEYKMNIHTNKRYAEQQFKEARFGKYFTGSQRQFYLDYYIHELPSAEMLRKYKSLSWISQQKAAIIERLRLLLLPRSCRDNNHASLEDVD